MSTEISPSSATDTPTVREQSASSRRSKSQAALGPVSEELDSILWRLKSRQAETHFLAVGIAGCDRKVGASTIARGLALQAGRQSARRVLLIETHADSKRRRRQPESRAGLCQIVVGDLAPLECPVASSMENVDILPSGGALDSTSGIEDRFVSDMFHQYSEHYDAVVVDLPTGGKLKSALPLARRLEAVLLVVCGESSSQTRAQEVVSLLAQDGVPVVGTVLNRYRSYVPRWLSRWF